MKNLQSAVNFAFTEMLCSLKGQGLFGADEQTCIDAFRAIGNELGMRQFTFGQSVATSGEMIPEDVTHQSQ